LKDNILTTRQIERNLHTTLKDNILTALANETYSFF